MPELPEVEVVRRDLEHEVVGKRIKTVEVDGLRSVRRHRNRTQFTARLEGRRIRSVRRWGKYLLLHLDDGGAKAGADDQDVLVVHLGMSGQLLLAPRSPATRPKHTHVVLGFTQGGELRFVDPRTFGEMFVTRLDELARVPELAHLGLDALEESISWERFGAMATARRVKLKALLMDQRFVAGIGNLYSDEILWGAGLRHDRVASTLTAEEVRRLYRSMVEVLQDAVRHRGSSLADESYVDVFGRLGGYQLHHNVYAREGELCRRCRHPIRRERYGGRSTFFCPACQV